MLSPPIVRSSGEGSTREQKTSGRVAARSTSAQRVTNQRPTAGTKHTGASRRSRAYTGYGSRSSSSTVTEAA